MAGSAKKWFSKADYLLFKSCPEELWLKWNRPDLIPPLSDDDFHNIEQGKKVDEFARILFRDEAFLSTQDFEAADVIFQKRFENGHLVAIPDILVRKSDSEYLLFEVKAATRLKPELAEDIAFQQIVLEEAGIKVIGTFLVHVNKKYVHAGDFKVNDLLTITETSAQVNEIIEETRKGITAAGKLIAGPEPEKKIPFHCGKKTDCPFFKLHYPDLPAYSVFDVSRLQRKKLKQLTDAGIFDIKKVPEAFPLSDKQRLQVEIAKSEEVIIKSTEIAELLSRLEYPFYFLDYETFSYVIPSQDGLVPYQQMVFQYSLHVREKEGGELKHYEYLLREKEEPILNLVEHLSKHLDPSVGTVIVWHDTFEKARNRELARMYPAYKDFFRTVNEKIFDLEDLFEQHLYSHPEFHGKSSIKKVLPVLAPEYDYSALDISNGKIATLHWHHMTNGRYNAGNSEKVYNHLLEYCRLDTLAMVKIFEKLKQTVES